MDVKLLKTGQLLLLFVFLLSCTTSTISVDKDEIKKVKTVAIMKFDHAEGIDKEIASECEESFRGHFINLGIAVLEREKLNSILKEVETSQTGIVDDSMQIGRLSGAQALLFGKITQNNERVEMVTYNEYIKDKITKKQTKVEKRKKKKFFTFQLNIRMVSTSSGKTILTLKNAYPERDYEMTSRVTLAQFRERILSQMGDDLKGVVE